MLKQRTKAKDIVKKKLSVINIKKYPSLPFEREKKEEKKICEMMTVIKRLPYYI